MGAMNRHQRRVAKAQGIGGKLDPVIAIHEAGHAVARVLGAADFGLPAEKMVSHIDVGTAENLGESHFDKSVRLTSQAVTYGPTLSSEIQAIFNRITQGVDPNKLTKQHIVEALKAAKDEGADVARWLTGRARATLAPCEGGRIDRHMTSPQIPVSTALNPGFREAVERLVGTAIRNMRQ